MSVKIIAQITGKTPKTTSVVKQSLKRHRIYGKQFRVTKKFLVDNPKDLGEVGDYVEITDTRPVSKCKKWTVVKVIEKK